MSIFGIIFLTATSLMMLEFLVHMIIYAKTGRGGFNDPPFAIYGELIREARARRKNNKKIPDKNARKDADTAA